MIVIGLTGNFGTGKTTVSHILEELGASVINADELSRLFLQPDTDSYQELVDFFGSEILDANGEIDRRKLGEIAFNKPGGGQRINEIMHPRIYRKIKEILESYRLCDIKVVIIEAALFFADEKLVQLCDQRWIANAPRAVILERLKKYRGYREEEIIGRLGNQMPAKEMIKRADLVINTDCTMEELRKRVTELWHKVASK
jgi:dephospho-CoA kinase